MARFPVTSSDQFQNPEFGVDPSVPGLPGLDQNPLGPTPAPGVPNPISSTPSDSSSSSSGGGPTPSIVSNFKVKALLLNNALTSHYVCKFQPPGPALAFIQQGGVNYSNPTSQELIELSCSEASLPGSSMMTNEINDDHTGVTERHAYRRQYDDRIDFTFYVDRNYDIITFFERWISYCAGENLQTALETRNYFYRVNFPIDYQTNALYVTKFERDVFGTALEYKFIGAYPISITSMPISYDASQLLKCTVSFTYIRYVRKVVKAGRPTEPGPTPVPGLPSIGNPNSPFPAVPGAPTQGTQFGTTPGFPTFGGPPLAPQSTAPGVPSTLLGQPTGSGSATLVGRNNGGSQRTTAGSQELPRVSSQTTAQPNYNKNAGTGAVNFNANPNEEGTLQLTLF